MDYKIRLKNILPKLSSVLILKSGQSKAWVSPVTSIVQDFINSAKNMNIAVDPRSVAGSIVAYALELQI
jgi:hypothetical protein